MGIQRYNVTLEEETVNMAKKKLGYSGGRLSPVINNLLDIWIQFGKETEDLIKKLFKNKEENTKVNNQ